MKRLISKIIEFLLKKTEHLNPEIDNSNTQDDPMQKKIQELLEKKELMKSALNQANQEKNSKNTDN
jgi:hypothetical protein